MNDDRDQAGEAGEAGCPILYHIIAIGRGPRMRDRGGNCGWASLSCIVFSLAVLHLTSLAVLPALRIIKMRSLPSTHGDGNGPERKEALNFITIPILPWFLYYLSCFISFHVCVWTWLSHPHRRRRRPPRHLLHWWMFPVWLTFQSPRRRAMMRRDPVLIRTERRWKKVREWPNWRQTPNSLPTITIQSNQDSAHNPHHSRQIEILFSKGLFFSSLTAFFMAATEKRWKGDAGAAKYADHNNHSFTQLTQS